MQHGNQPHRQRFFAMITIGILLATATAFAQPNPTAESKPNNLPTEMILPWVFHNLDQDFTARHRKALAESHKKLAQALDPSAAPLASSYQGQSSLTAIQKAFLQEAFVTSNQATPRAWIPSLSVCQGQVIAHLSLVDSRTSVLLATTHVMIEEDLSKANQKKIDVEKLFTDRLQNMMTRINDTLTQSASRSPDLAVALENQTHASRRDEWDRDSLNLILAETYLNQMTVISPIGQNELAKLHRIYGLTEAMRRPNRTLTLSWIFPDKKELLARKLPTTIALKITSSESVFAKELPWKIEETVSISRSTLPNSEIGQINVNLTSTLRDQLLVEEKALTRGENPQVAKIYGAWVYLDKGRAFGLRMNDRLTIASGDGSIKGHVVGYFGPELKLKSPRGWPIHEGAILFVRKGQRLTTIGQEFSYDKMTVPTPWPPVSKTTN